MKQQIIARWNALSKKEQVLLMALTLFMLCLLVYAYAWIPVQHGRQRLTQVIPEKQGKLMLMRVQAAEIESLRGQQYKLLHAEAGALKATIEVSAKYHGLVPSYSAQSDDEKLSLTLSKVGFDTWIKWVESLQSQHQVRLRSCHIVSLPSGQINIEAVFSAFE
jgi:general secretion pathway protein M